MGEADRIPVPYTEEFRRARRNSLVWSSLTIAAAFGTSTGHDGMVTSSSVGLSLGYDQDVIVGLFGIVAIFMAVGFIQALTRLLLYASNLFAGKTDVETTFAALSQRANEIWEKLADFESRHQGLMKDVNMPFGRIGEINDELLELQFPTGDSDDFKWITHREGSPGGMVPITNPEVLVSNFQRWAKGERGRVETVYKQLKGFSDEINEEISKAQSSRDALLLPFRASETAKMDTDLLALQAKVIELRRFHDGIYRSDRMWLWLWDVGPTGMLFAIALIFTTRAFLS